MHDYIFLIVPFTAILWAQLFKFTIESIVYKKICWGRLFNGCGGMPSSHTTFCFSLTTLIGLESGVKTPLFAIALIFSFVIAYDAMGLRMESGKQAQAINDIVEKLFEGKKMEAFAHLKEELGHNPLEVVMGMLFGFVYAFILFLLLL